MAYKKSCDCQGTLEALCPKMPPQGPPTNLRPAGAHKQKKEEPRSLVKRKLAAILAEIAEGP